MASSDLSVLLDMGFDKERAELAVKKSGGCMFRPFSPLFYSILMRSTVQGALQWLEDNQDKSMEEIAAAATSSADAAETDPSIMPAVLQEGEVAKSMVCNECGKKFRSMAQAEFHAS